jgi:GNAT superfamily N-acetyltransferase
MANTLTIKLLDNNYCNQIVDLILPIQLIEFKVPITMEGQPDLLDIATTYLNTGGGFWGAIYNNELVGTIALMPLGHNSAAIRKMFVKKEFRGKEYGTAQLLFETLLTYSKAQGLSDLYLGTVDMLKAAHRFYERNDFIKKERQEMPDYFPHMMSENVYYHLPLKNKL